MRGFLPPSLPTPIPYKRDLSSGSICSLLRGDLRCLGPGRLCCSSKRVYAPRLPHHLIHASGGLSSMGLFGGLPVGIRGPARMLFHKLFFCLVGAAQDRRVAHSIQGIAVLLVPLPA